MKFAFLFVEQIFFYVQFDFVQIARFFIVIQSK